MKFKSFAVAALLSAMSLEDVQAAGGKNPYSYLLNGADWPFDKTSECWMTNQSPIDLRTDMHSNPFPKEDGLEINT